MRSILFLCLFISIISIIDGQWDDIEQQRILPMQQVSFLRPQNNANNIFMFRNQMDNGFRLQSDIRIPFPQCLSTDAASSLLTPESLQKLFQIKLQEENGKLKQDRVRNNILNNSMK
jgi:hypothetical protein